MKEKLMTDLNQNNKS